MQYSLGLYEKSMPNSLPLQDKLALARDAGFDFLELSIDESDEKICRLDWDACERLQLVHAIYLSSLPVKTICLSGHRKFPIGSLDGAIRMRGLEMMRKAIQLASDIGVRIIQLAGYDEYYQVSTAMTRSLFLDGLSQSVDWAAREGVILAFETMETEFMDTARKAMKYVKMINSPYLQVYPDAGNLKNAAVKYGSNEFADLSCAKGHIAAVHLKESLPGKYRETPYGSGHVDFKHTIQTAMELGARMFLAEFWYIGNEDWKDQLGFASAFLRENLRAASHGAMHDNDSGIIAVSTEWDLKEQGNRIK